MLAPRLLEPLAQIEILGPHPVQLAGPDETWGRDEIPVTLIASAAA